MSQSPPDLRTILARYRDLRLTRAINIFFQDDGRVQVAVQRGREMSFYGATGEPEDNPVDTLIKALKPNPLERWDDLLKLAEADFDEAQEADEIKDDMNDVI